MLKLNDTAKSKSSLWCFVSELQYNVERLCDSWSLLLICHVVCTGAKLHLCLNGNMQTESELAHVHWLQSQQCQLTKLQGGTCYLLLRSRTGWRSTLSTGPCDTSMSPLSCCHSQHHPDNKRNKQNEMVLNHLNQPLSCITEKNLKSVIINHELHLHKYRIHECWSPRLLACLVWICSVFTLWIWLVFVGNDVRAEPSAGRQDDG